MKSIETKIKLITKEDLEKLNKIEDNNEQLYLENRANIEDGFIVLEDIEGYVDINYESYTKPKPATIYVDHIVMVNEGSNLNESTIRTMVGDFTSIESKSTINEKIKKA